MQIYPEMKWLLWAYNFVFSMTTAVLLLNALIALMGKTVDTVYESSSTHAQFIFARITLAQLKRPAEPPPLNLLRIPAYVVAAMLAILVYWFPASKPLAKARSIMMDSFEYSTLLAADSPMATNTDSATGEYIGTTLRLRSTFEAWKTAWSDERLNAHVGNFIDSREAHVGASEGMTQSRHRALMKKETAMLLAQQLESMQRELNGSIDKLHERMDSLAVAVRPADSSEKQTSLADSSSDAPQTGSRPPSTANSTTGALQTKPKRRPSVELGGVTIPTGATGKMAGFSGWSLATDFGASGEDAKSSSLAC